MPNEKEVDIGGGFSVTVFSNESLRLNFPRSPNGQRVSIPADVPPLGTWVRDQLAWLATAGTGVAMPSPIVSMATDVGRFLRDLAGITPPVRPRCLSADRFEVRMNHLREELEETVLTQKKGDVAQVADGLIDLVYVALGTLLEMGFTPAAMFHEVHAANMRKERGSTGKRKAEDAHDVLKPAGWTPPDVEKFLRVTNADVDWVIDQQDMIAEYDADSHEQEDDLPMTKPRLMIIGNARHGKDTVCELLRDAYGFSFTSSSFFCAEEVILPKMPAGKYANAQECFDDRGNNRALWYDLITEFNQPDASALGRAIYAKHDIYCGIRNSTEFHAVRNAGLFDVAIWVDASKRLPPEDKSSMTLEPWMADYILDNNGTLDQLKLGLRNLMQTLGVAQVDFMAEAAE